MEKLFVSYLHRFNRTVFYLILFSLIVSMTIISFTSTYSKYALRTTSAPMSITAKTVWAGDFVIPPLDMIFSLTTYYLAGSSTIEGDAGTNSTEPGAVYFAWSTGLNGNLFIGPGADPAEVVEGMRPDPVENMSGHIFNLPEAREYPLPRFPGFPELPYKGDLNAAWDPPGPFVINESGSYGSINVESLLTVEIGDEDVLVVVNSLTVKANGKLVVNKTGAGRLIIYAAETLEILGSGSINNGGDFNDVNIYYAGSQTLDFGGNCKLYGSVFAEKADILIGGSWGIKGHIISGGYSVKVTGDASANVRAIYAPNASLYLEGSGKISGIAVAKNITLTGHSHIYYSNTIDTGFFEEQVWSQ